ncbi:MAG: thioredoxin family protein [Acidobacteriota bacterium]
MEKEILIELYYFDGCPAYKKTFDNLLAATRELHGKIHFSLKRIDSYEEAELLGFQGSPSIKVNGQDLEGLAEGATYACRLYSDNGTRTPTPSKELLLRMLRKSIES